uniref:Uncharacterized protein n=1 Tax=Glossina austeni TaxID=7395 RepID=A0A1A9UUH8_GLOAU
MPWIEFLIAASMRTFFQKSINIIIILYRFVSSVSTVCSDKENLFFFASASEQSVSDWEPCIHNNHRRKPMELDFPDWFASYLLLYVCSKFLIEVYSTLDYIDLLYVFLQSSFKS